jgi:cell division protein FtsQ
MTNLRRPARSLAAAATVAACAIAAVTALAWLADLPRFGLHRIVVTGAPRHVSRADLRGALGGHLRGNFFTLPLADARLALRSIPWVADAGVRRVWPGRLELTLTERRAIGLWDDGRLVSDAGVLFAGNPAEAEADGPLIDFEGPPAQSEAAVEHLAQFRNALAPAGLQVSSLRVSERLSWSLRTRGGPTFDLGRDEPAGSAARRLALVAAAYPGASQALGGAPARIDARYENGFAASAP